jgi:hypothetical protein
MPSISKGREGGLALVHQTGSADGFAICSRPSHKAGTTTNGISKLNTTE